jgi:hypothetical protein
VHIGNTLPDFELLGLAANRDDIAGAVAERLLLDPVIGGNRCTDKCRNTI